MGMKAVHGTGERRGDMVRKKNREEAHGRGAFGLEEAENQKRRSDFLGNFLNLARNLNSNQTSNEF